MHCGDPPKIDTENIIKKSWSEALEVRCVDTGGTGFIGSSLVARLLDKGYSVHTTLRCAPDSKRDISYLTNLPGAAERLQIFYNADLDCPETSAQQSRAVSVFHVAHPVDVSTNLKDEVDIPEATITQTSLGGMLGILKICMELKTVKRVVYTSSGGTIMFNGKTAEIGVADEDMWSDLEVCKQSSFCPKYLVSKTITEKKGLEFAEENGLDVVSCVLPLVIGPYVCPFIPASVYLAASLFFGKPEIFEVLPFWYVAHTEDAMDAHVFLMENLDTKGRYICCSVKLSAYDLANFLSLGYSDFNIPITDKIKETKDYKGPSLSTKKLLDAGFEYKHVIEGMYSGLVQSCKDRGFL